LPSLTDDLLRQLLGGPQVAIAMVADARASLGERQRARAADT
jgi:hypothetical protein